MIGQSPCPSWLLAYAAFNSKCYLAAGQDIFYTCCKEQEIELGSTSHPQGSYLVPAGCICQLPGYLPGWLLHLAQDLAPDVYCANTASAQAVFHYENVSKWFAPRHECTFFLPSLLHILLKACISSFDSKQQKVQLPWPFFPEQTLSQLLSWGRTHLHHCS